jgi:hypothetical protein
MDIGKTLLFVFLILSIISFIFSMINRGGTPRV